MQVSVETPFLSIYFLFFPPKTSTLQPAYPPESGRACERSGSRLFVCCCCTKTYQPLSLSLSIYIYIYIYYCTPTNPRYFRAGSGHCNVSICWYSVYLLYWYKSTNTDTCAAKVPVSDDDLTLGEQEQQEKRLAAVQAALLGMEELFALALEALAMAGILYT